MVIYLYNLYRRGLDVKKKTIFFLCLVVLIAVLAINYSINTLENAVKEGEIVDTIPLVDGSKFVISKTNDSVFCDRYNRTILGWKVTHSSGPARGVINKPISRSNVMYCYYGNIGVFFGFVNPEEVKTIRLKTDNMIIDLLVESTYWYILFFTDDLSKGYSYITTVSFILKDGTKVTYPFDK